MDYQRDLVYTNIFPFFPPSDAQQGLREPEHTYVCRLSSHKLASDTLNVMDKTNY